MCWLILFMEIKSMDDLILFAIAIIAAFVVGVVIGKLSVEFSRY